MPSSDICSFILTLIFHRKGMQNPSAGGDTTRMRDPVKSEGYEYIPEVQRRSSHGKHASWADQKVTSDEDILISTGGDTTRIRDSVKSDEDEGSPEPQTRSSHGRHTSWADHKFTSDGDILSLNSPLPSGHRGASEDGHVRSLSGQLLGMNLSPDNSVTYSPDPESTENSEFENDSLNSSLNVPSNLGAPAYPTQQASENVGRKHRRGLSGGKSNPAMAHRRVDSGGNTAFIDRQGALNDGMPFDRRAQHQPRPYPMPHQGQHYLPPKEHLGYQGHHGHWNHHDRGPSPHDRGPSPHDRRPSPHDRGPSPHDRRPSPHNRGPSPHDNRPLPHDRRPSPHDRGPSPHDRGPSPHDRRPSPHDRRPSPHYDRDPGYVPPHIPPPPQHYRTAPHPSPPPSRYAHHRDHVHQYSRQDGSAHRGPPGAPPRYQDHRDAYPPNPPEGPDSIRRHSAEAGMNGVRGYSPDNFSHHPNQYHRDEHAPNYPGRGHKHPPHAVYHTPPHPHPVQNNERIERRTSNPHVPPLHPLADHSHHSLPPGPNILSYQRQTSHGSAEGRIETEENLFAAGPQAVLSTASPRISPQLFDQVLNSQMQTTPPHSLHYHDEFVQGIAPVHLPPNDNRIRTASSDSFMRAIETSQVHRRGISMDSLVIDDDLFGESILASSVEGDRTRTFASMSILTGATEASAPVPSAFMDPIAHTGFDAYPEQIQSHGNGIPPYEYGAYPMHSHNAPVEALPVSGHTSESLNTKPAGDQSPPTSSVASDDAESLGRQISGTVSKRTRRKCAILGCGNRVVQGGLCISHGAKRKTCGHLGCTKHVKKAGMCSAHGPPRKLCEFGTCSKVAVQGGRCIAHGAKKKLCSVESCKKQAILNGMCKRHHDEDIERNAPICQPVQRGGSGSNDKTVDGEREGQRRPAHARGLSIFTDNDFQEKMMSQEINLSRK